MKKAIRFTNILYLPVLFLLIALIIVPFLNGIRISFTDWNGFSQEYNYVAFQNFKVMFEDPNVQTALLNTFLFGFGSTILQQIIGISYAVFLNTKFFANNITRIIIYLPVLIAPIVMGYMWTFLLKSDGGALNDVLKLIGLKPVVWLSDPALIKVIYIFINSIQYVGVSMIIYLAGLQGIPKMYYEAAEIDGASSWNKFRKITLPLLYPAIITSATLNLIGGLKIFDIIKALTNGTPGYTTNSLSTLINRTYFGTQQAGYASVQGLLLFITILAVTLVLQFILRKRGVEY
ncbi:carbohydrate ABC transporter permease [Priestia megaterium]|uniref:carbohydrate ABC transporter permease n=1 Tax=Priestia megaterium TaxID=1404 RepID=UPI0036DB27E7